MKRNLYCTPGPRSGLLALSLLAVLSHPAAGVSVVVEEGSFTGSSLDLINSGSPDLAAVFLGAGSSGAMHDGSPATYTAWATGDFGFSSVNTFNLDTVANPAGYRISEIEVVTAFGAGGIATGGPFGYWNQRVLIEYSTVGTTDYFELVEYDEGPVEEDPGGYRVTVSEPAFGVDLAYGVDSLRFTILDPRERDAGVVISELDVFGRAEPVPEPGMALLGGLAGLVALGRRRR